MRDRKGVDTDERGGGEGLEGAEERETVIRIYYMGKIMLNINFEKVDSSACGF